jgi:hypothetical protein
VPAGDGGEESRRITLDPRFSLRENMSRMFREAARGKRGLEMLRLRRNDGTDAGSETEQVSGEPAANVEAKRVFGAPAVDVGTAEVSEAHTKDALFTGMEDDGSNVSGAHTGEQDAGVSVRGGQAETTTAGNTGAFSSCADGQERTPGGLSRARLLPPSVDGRELQGIARFRSSDGFLLWRGRNAAGNNLLLKSGAAHDYWLHAEGLPGAHVLVRRAHAAEEVPERTLREAAALATEKSAAQDGATVMVALLRHVRHKAKSAPGAVEIASLLRRIRVDDTRNDPAGP